jgi:hypothetical protein
MFYFYYILKQKIDPYINGTRSYNRKDMLVDPKFLYHVKYIDDWF